MEMKRESVEIDTDRSSYLIKKLKKNNIDYSLSKSDDRKLTYISLRKQDYELIKDYVQELLDLDRKLESAIPEMSQRLDLSHERRCIFRGIGGTILLAVIVPYLNFCIDREIDIIFPMFTLFYLALTLNFTKDKFIDDDDDDRNTKWGWFVSNVVSKNPESEDSALPVSLIAFSLSIIFTVLYMILVFLGIR